jgi:hypothetical protein
MKIKITVLCAVTPYSLVDRYQQSGGTWYNISWFAIYVLI